MSYRITEAERNHVSVVEELQVQFKRRDESNTLDTQVQLIVTDGDALDITIDLPRYRLDKDNVGRSRLKLVDEKYNTTSIIDNVGWDFNLENDAINGYISNIILTRLNDSTKFIVPINKLVDLEVNTHLQVNGSLTAASALIDNNLTVSGLVNIANGLTIQHNGATIKGGVTVSKDGAVSGDLTVADGGLYVVTGKTQLQNTEVESLDVNKLATISGLQVNSNAEITGTLKAGQSTLSSLGVTGNQTVGGTLGVTGNQTVGGTLGVAGNQTNGGTLTVSKSAILNDSLYVSGNQRISGTLLVKDKTTLGVAEINSPDSGFINIKKVNAINGSISGIIFDTLSGRQVTVADLVSEDITANDISTDVLNVNTDTTLSGTVDAFGDITLSGLVTVGGTKLSVKSESKFEKDSVFVENVGISGNLKVNTNLEVDKVSTLHDNTYIGTAKNAGIESKDLFVLGSTNITDVNRTKEENKIVLYSSGLLPEEVAYSQEKWRTSSAERIKAIINGEIQYLATLEDIDGISAHGAVTLNTIQTISANKYFSGAAIFSDQLYAFYDGPATPGSVGTNDMDYRLIEQITVDNNELAVKVGNIHSHLDLYVNEDMIYGKPDSHIKVYRDNNLPQTYIPYVEDVILGKFSDPTNGQILGNLNVKENYIDNKYATVDFTTLNTKYDFEKQISGIAATSGITSLNFRSDNLIFAKNDDRTLSINVSGYDKIFETLEDLLDSPVNISVAVSGVAEQDIGFRSTTINVSVAEAEDSVVLNGISGIKINPTANGDINVSLTQIDYSFGSDANSALPENERFPTTGAVKNRIEEEHLRAETVERTIINRLPEAPDPIGFYTMTARTLDPTTKIYGWSAATLPPTPMTGDIDDDPADPHKDGDEFVLKFVLQSAATGAGSLVWEKVK